MIVPDEFGPGSDYNRAAGRISENMHTRLGLCHAMSTFMLGVAELTRDSRTIEASRRYWDTSEWPNITDRVHNFGVEGAREFHLPEWLSSAV